MIYRNLAAWSWSLAWKKTQYRCVVINHEKKTFNSPFILSLTKNHSCVHTVHSVNFPKHAPSSMHHVATVEAVFIVRGMIWKLTSTMISTEHMIQKAFSCYMKKKKNRFFFLSSKNVSVTLQPRPTPPQHTNVTYINSLT